VTVRVPLLCSGEGRLPGIDFRQLRLLVPLRDVLDLLGWQPRTRRGEHLRGPCPLLEPNRDRSFGAASPALSMAGAVARVRFWGVAGPGHHPGAEATMPSSCRTQVSCLAQP
jgi:hypothetical protein